MNAKDLRTEAALGDRSNDGNTKYAQSGGAMPCHRNKIYQDIGSSSLAKVDAPPARPCAVIGPDRVVPPPALADYHKKSPLEPWLTPDNTYRRPPEYPHKLLDYQLPSRNISPRQTFQENMQRIMVPPSYNAVKLKEDHNFPAEPNFTQMRNNKLNVPTDSNTKYCDVPYSVNPITNDQKNVRNSDVSVSNMNTVLARGAPHGWPPTSSNIQPPKPFHQDLCQYPEYQNCVAPRQMVMTRPHRTVQEDPGPVYPEAYYQHGNIRFKPYPPVKERYPQTRYEYIGNYSNPFHPPPSFPTHKYDLQKPLPSHPYSNYSQVPLKYLDSRMADPIMNGYQRSLNQQPTYSNVPYRNQVIHPTYGPVPGNCLPTGKYYPYPPDGAKSIPPNKLPYDANGKLYPDYENNRSKNYPTSDAFYVNDMGRIHPTKGPIIPPNYPTNIHAIPAHPYYRKEPLKGYEYSPHFRTMDHMLGVNGNFMARFPSQFSPTAIAISPSDSNTSNDTNQNQGICQEDCGYVSQSSTASVRSMDSFTNRIPPEMYRRYDHRYGNIIRGSAAYPKFEHSASGHVSSKEKKGIDVRQFLQMWNEGEDEGGENNNKEVIIKTVPNNGSNSISAANYEAANQEQLYVLGLVNVPSEELGKYEHIQKVSKLPENIKGYNSIELLHQFEEVIESSNLNHYNTKSPNSKQFHDPMKSTVPMQGIGIPSRPLSPLDVEAKISQSVIHKEVGCNFEIKPCSPKMLNAEVATPVQTVIDERMIEKVSNSLINQPQIRHHVNESRDIKIASCKMVNKLYGNKEPVDPVKTNYSIQDLESNSGVCLASLPRLDNDIELNFPEVNQQFINANKVESVITSAPIKDLPPIDADQTHTINREVETDIINSDSKRNLEKDFTKLSKYRKLKKKSSEPNTPESNVQALRTDSVIIKNPENCKHENFERTLSPKTMSKQAQDDPINLSVNTDNRVNTDTLHLGSNEANDVKTNDFAIDFSINSNETGNVADSKIPEAIATENDDLNGCNIVRQEKYKQNLSESQDHAAFIISESIRDEKEITKTDENKCNLNTQASCDKESLDITTTADQIINSPKSILQDPDKSKNELSVAFPISEEKHDVTDKETLNKKLSSYNLLSSQEKEDTLNEKMRELFGEEFSTVETEHDYEQIHDTQSILDDVSVDNIGKDYVFSDESSQSNDDYEACAMPEDHENEIQDSTCYKEPREKTKQNWDLVSKDALLSQSLYEKGDYDNRNVESIKIAVAVLPEDKMDERLSLSDINTCLLKQKRKPMSDFWHASKELFSPWIQKLIVHHEGCCGLATADLMVLKKFDEGKKDSTDNIICSKFSEMESGDNICEIAEDYDCAGVITTIYDSNNDENMKSYACIETTIETRDNIADNVQRESSLKVLNTANNGENDENIKTCDKQKKYICYEDVEIKNNNTSCDTINDHVNKVIKTIDDHIINNNLESDNLATETLAEDTKTEECDKNCEVDNTLNTADTHENYNKSENASTNTEVLELINNTVNDLMIPGDHQVAKSIKCDSILESTCTEILLMSSKESCEEVASVSEKILDSAVNHKTEEDLIIHNQMTSISNTGVFIFTEICTKVAINTENNDNDFTNCEMLESNNKCSDDVETALYCKSNNILLPDTCGKIIEKTTEISSDSEIAQSDTCNNDLDNNKNNEYIKALDSEINLRENKEIILCDKNLDELNCESNISRWSLHQTPEHTGILSPLTPDTDSNESQALYDRNVSVTCSITDENNANYLKFISKDDCFNTNKNIIQQSSNGSKISEETETSTNFSNTEVNKNAELILTENSEEVSIDDLEPNKILDSITSAAACNSNSKLGKTSNEYSQENPSIIPQTSISQTISENILERIDTEDVETNICYNNETESILEELTSCSDVSDETSASDYDNGSESIDTNVPQNNEESSNPIFDMAAHQVADNGRTDNRTEVFEKNELLSVEANELFIDNLSSNNFDNKIKDAVDQLSEMQDHVNMGIEKDFTTSKVQDVEAECSNDDNTNCEQDNMMDNNISEQLLSHPNILRDTTVENISILKDCVAQDKLEALHEVIENTVNGSQDLDTNFVHVAENVIDDSGILLESSQEHTNIELLKDTSSNDVSLHDSSKNLQYSTSYLAKRRKSLKRSLSDSALDDIKENFNEEPLEHDALLWPNKRKKDDELNHYNTSRFIAENICQVLQSNRRNSVSSIHNEGNVSFCILIDNNCIISEECDEPAKLCFSEVRDDCLASIQEESLDQDEVPDDCLARIQEESLDQADCTDEINFLQEDNDCKYSTLQTNLTEADKSIDEPWVDDVACVETVVSEDIAENIVISASTSPKDDEYDDDETDYDLNEHTDKLKYIYGDKMYNDDTHFVQTLYRTPQMNVNKTLNHREYTNITDDSQIDDGCRYYDKESLERVLSESNVQDESASELVSFRHRKPLPNNVVSEMATDDNENLKPGSCLIYESDLPFFQNAEHDIGRAYPNEKCNEYSNTETKERIINSCESSIDDVFNFKKSEESLKFTSSSPEVSSTTSEEKNSSILLKITNYGGSRISQVNDINPLNRISCKYTEKKDYSSSNGNLPTRTLITKGAQKYIPPLKETIRDLKVKLPLPQQSLIKFKQLKLAKEALKPNIDKPSNNLKKEVPKKTKPKFEDVLKSIDEMQYQQHKEKNKKGRKSIPKVVIKKNEHGSHYASTSSKHIFNPDLTGMKWQPWVFLEKDSFIDKMALRKKGRAIFSHRKNTYVLAEKFQKYKSVCNTKFVISHPKHVDPTSGELKYTIRLKHNY